MMQQIDGRRWENFPESIRNIFEGIWQEVVRLHVSWSLYQDLFTNPEDMQVINKTVPSVFQMIEENLRDSMIVAFDRLTDPSKTQKRRQSIFDTTS